MSEASNYQFQLMTMPLTTSGKLMPTIIILPKTAMRFTSTTTTNGETSTPLIIRMPNNGRLAVAAGTISAACRQDNLAHLNSSDSHSQQATAVSQHHCCGGAYYSQDCNAAELPATHQKERGIGEKMELSRNIKLIIVLATNCIRANV